jgi:hypothetical protein
MGAGASLTYQDPLLQKLNSLARAVHLFKRA